MQSTQLAQDSHPAWLKPQYFIDVKDKQDKQCQWKVALILHISKTHIRVRYDGLTSRFDQSFPINSPNIKPFRSITRGYTGHTEIPGVRDHYSFSSINLKQNYEKQLLDFIRNMYTKSQLQINQFIRGTHYTWTDFLLSQVYKTVGDIHAVYEYYKKHFDLTLKYLSDMLKCQYFEEWFNGTVQLRHSQTMENRQSYKAFAECYFEIFDSVYCIMDNSIRLKSFFKANQALLCQLIENKSTFLQFMNTYISKIQLLQTLEQVIERLDRDQKSRISLTFLHAFLKLYYSLQKTIRQKQKKKRLTEKLCQIIFKQTAKLTETNIKDDEHELYQIYLMCKLIVHKHESKYQILSKFQLININSWKCLIMSQKLEKKRRGISKLLQYYANLTSTHKKQNLVFNSKENIDNQIRKKQIINAIFYQNDHYDIIKKGCDLVYSLYKGNAIGTKQLQVVWRSCRNRLEAVRKVMYFFFQTICKQFKFQDLTFFVKLLIGKELVDEIDKNFYCSVFKAILGWAEEDKIPILKQLFQFSYNRILLYPEQIKQFSELITMKKSQNFGLLSEYAKLLINQIQNYQSNLIYIKLLNNIYQQSSNKYLKIQPNSFNKVFKKLCNILKQKQQQKKQNPEKQSQNKKQIIKQLLTLLENMSIGQFQFHDDDFLQLWKLFNQSHNFQIKQTIYLKWILNISTEGILKRQVPTINKCIRQKIRLKSYIFNNMLKQHKILEYVHISEMQLKIFEKFMIEVNQDQGKLNQIVHKLTMITYFRMNQNGLDINGLNQLWAIFQNCSGNSQMKRAVKLILNFYLNYKVEVSYEIKSKKIQELLNKISHNIDLGQKKNNKKLVKNSLFLLHELIVQVKQTFTEPKFSNPNIKQFNKTIKIQKDKSQSFELEIKSTQNIKSMKKKLSEHFQIPSYNIKLYKLGVEYVVVHEDHNFSSSDASASSVHTEFNHKHKERINRCKNYCFEEIPKQMYVAPIFALMLQENEGKIVVKEQRNIILQKLNEYICQKLSKKLLQILQQQQKQLAQLTYLILTQIPSNMNPMKTLTNLMTQLTSKTQKSQTKSPDQLNLHQQTINFRMYFYKNINLLKDNQFQQFINKKNIQFDQDLSKQISRNITENIEVQLMLEIINIVKKSFNKNKKYKINCNANDILECLTNVLQFIIIQKNSKDNQSNSNANYMKLFYQCFVTLESMLHDDYAKIIDCIVQFPHFQKLMHYLYENLPKSKYSNEFALKLQYYFHSQKLPLSQQTQQIICHVVFDTLYSKVLSNKEKKHLSFFKIIKNIITIASHEAIQKLFQSQIQIQNHQQTFWEICLTVIRKQSDFYHEDDKQNTLFSCHLSILEALIRNNPEKVDQGLWKMVFYECLFYSEQYTQGIDVKCCSTGSIKEGLSLLFTICKISQKCLMKTIRQLRNLQMGKDWRTPDQWSANINVDQKSLCGFVGLQNPGCICYLNSFIQTLFINEQFRNKVINFRQTIEGQDYSLLIEMRKLFLNLQYSQQKFIDPVPFSKTIKNNQGKPLIKIFQQMDIEQYSSILFDKIEKLLPKGQDFVKQIFQGTYSNDIISKQCKHSSQRQQNFLSMQLDVKSMLEDSLKILVHGEVMEGENAYFCQKCNRKVKAVKRMSIKKLPNYLIICLKRFQYNFEIDQKIKVNAFCQFPKQITFQQYSQQFLNSLQIQQPLSSERGEEIQSENPLLPHQYFQYKLKGVIIHTGSADSGHYYTLIQVDPESGKWIEFNDSSVTQFDIKKLPDEAFGSDDPMSFKFKNAYMLVYERKKKIHSKASTKIQQNMEQQQQMQQISTKSNQLQQKTQQSSLPFSGENNSQQAQKLHKQILLHNKQMRTFHLMLTNQYKQFVKQLISVKFYCNQNNSQIDNQQYQFITPNNIYLPNNKAKKQTNEQPKKYTHKQIIQNVIKFYLQHCIFIRSREERLNNFIQSLTDIQFYLSSKIGLPIIDYFIHQLCQQQLIYELFVAISIKDNLIVISHFILDIICIRLDKIQQQQKNRFYIIIFRFIKTLITVVIDNGVCINEIFYIIRKLVEKQKKIASTFLEIDLFSSAFEILAGVNQSDEDKKNKIQRITLEVEQLIQRFQQNNPSNKKKSQMQEQNKQVYEMKTVKKIGKCIIKHLSPQEVWNCLYFIYKLSQQQLKQYQLTIQNQSSFIQILSRRKDTYQSQLLQLKDDKISHFISDCQGSHAANSVSLFLSKISATNKKLIQKLSFIIEKALKDFQVIKMRNYLILTYHLVINGAEEYQQFEIKKIIHSLYNSLSHNAKFLSESDILHQWIIKLLFTSEKFTQMIVHTEEGIKICTEISKKLQLFRKPSQKNVPQERFKYVLHGLRICSDLDEHDKIYTEKKQIFRSLIMEKRLPPEHITIKKIQSLLQPTYQQLVKQIKIGNIMSYMFHKKIVPVFVKGYQYGSVKIQKIVKDHERGDKSSMIEEIIQEGKLSQQSNDKNNIIKINDMISDIGKGNKLCDEEEIVWETDQRLRTYNKLQKSASFQKNRNDQHRQGEYNMEDEHESVASSLSYSSENKV